MLAELCLASIAFYPSRADAVEAINVGIAETDKVINSFNHPVHLPEAIAPVPSGQAVSTSDVQQSLLQFVKHTGTLPLERHSTAPSRSFFRSLAPPFFDENDKTPHLLSQGHIGKSAREGTSTTTHFLITPRAATTTTLQCPGIPQLLLGEPGKVDAPADGTPLPSGAGCNTMGPGFGHPRNFEDNSEESSEHSDDVMPSDHINDHHRGTGNMQFLEQAHRSIHVPVPPTQSISGVGTSQSPMQEHLGDSPRESEYVSPVSVHFSIQSSASPSRIGHNNNNNNNNQNNVSFLSNRFGPSDSSMCDVAQQMLSPLRNSPHPHNIALPTAFPRACPASVPVRSMFLVLGVRVMMTPCQTPEAGMRSNELFFLAHRDQVEQLTLAHLEDLIGFAGAGDAKQSLATSVSVWGDDKRSRPPIDRELALEMNEGFLLQLPLPLKDTYSNSMRFEVELTVYNVPNCYRDDENGGRAGASALLASLHKFFLSRRAACNFEERISSSVGPDLSSEDSGVVVSEKVVDIDCSASVRYSARAFPARPQPNCESSLSFFSSDREKVNVASLLTNEGRAALEAHADSGEFKASVKAAKRIYKDALHPTADASSQTDSIVSAMRRGRSGEAHSFTSRACLGAPQGVLRLRSLTSSSAKNVKNLSKSLFSYPLGCTSTVVPVSFNNGGGTGSGSDNSRTLTLAQCLHCCSASRTAVVASSTVSILGLLGIQSSQYATEEGDGGNLQTLLFATSEHEPSPVIVSIRGHSSTEDVDAFVDAIAVNYKKKTCAGRGGSHIPEKEVFSAGNEGTVNAGKRATETNAGASDATVGDLGQTSRSALLSRVIQMISAVTKTEEVPQSATVGESHEARKVSRSLSNFVNSFKNDRRLNDSLAQQDLIDLVRVSWLRNKKDAPRAVVATVMLQMTVVSLQGSELAALAMAEFSRGGVRGSHSMMSPLGVSASSAGRAHGPPTETEPLPGYEKRKFIEQVSVVCGSRGRAPGRGRVSSLHRCSQGSAAADKSAAYPTRLRTAWSFGLFCLNIFFSFLCRDTASVLLGRSLRWSLASIMLSALLFNSFSPTATAGPLLVQSRSLVNPTGSSIIYHRFGVRKGTKMEKSTVENLVLAHASGVRGSTGELLGNQSTLRIAFGYVLLFYILLRAFRWVYCVILAIRNISAISVSITTHRARLERRDIGIRFTEPNRYDLVTGCRSRQHVIHSRDQLVDTDGGASGEFEKGDQWVQPNIHVTLGEFFPVFPTTAEGRLVLGLQRTCPPLSRMPALIEGSVGGSSTLRRSTTQQLAETIYLQYYNNISYREWLKEVESGFSRFLYLIATAPLHPFAISHHIRSSARGEEFSQSFSDVVTHILSRQSLLLLRLIWRPPWRTVRTVLLLALASVLYVLYFYRAPFVFYEVCLLYSQLSYPINLSPLVTLLTRFTLDLPALIHTFCYLVLNVLNRVVLLTVIILTCLQASLYSVWLVMYHIISLESLEAYLKQCFYSAVALFRTEASLRDTFGPLFKLTIDRGGNSSEAPRLWFGQVLWIIFSDIPFVLFTPITSEELVSFIVVFALLLLAVPAVEHELRSRRFTARSALRSDTRKTKLGFWKRLYLLVDFVEWKHTSLWDRQVGCEKCAPASKGRVFLFIWAKTMRLLSFPLAILFAILGLMWDAVLSVFKLSARSRGISCTAPNPPHPMLYHDFLSTAACGPRVRVMQHTTANSLLGRLYVYPVEEPGDQLQDPSDVLTRINEILLPFNTASDSVQPPPASSACRCDTLDFSVDVANQTVRLAVLPLVIATGHAFVHLHVRHVQERSVWKDDMMIPYHYFCAKSNFFLSRFYDSLGCSAVNPDPSQLAAIKVALCSSHPFTFCNNKFICKGLSVVRVFSQSDFIARQKYTQRITAMLLHEMRAASESSSKSHTDVQKTDRTETLERSSSAERMRSATLSGQNNIRKTTAESLRPMFGAEAHKSIVGRSRSKTSMNPQTQEKKSLTTTGASLKSGLNTHRQTSAY